MRNRVLTSGQLCQNENLFSSANRYVSNPGEKPDSALVPLPALRLLRVAGGDRQSFLQGQFTQDFGQITAETAALTGWASARGRLLMVAQAVEWRDAVWLPVPSATAGTVCQKLAMFVLRADVTVEQSSVPVFGAFTDTALPPALVPGRDSAQGLAASRSDAGRCIMRLAGDPERSLLFGDIGELSVAPAEATEAWRLHDIQAGLPSIAAETSEAFVPQMVNLDLLGGISFSKGCYIGQEIVARTQNLGRIKRRMFRLRSSAPARLAPNDPIYGNTGVAGRIVSAVTDGEGSECLAVISLSMTGDELFVDENREIRAAVRSLPYPIPEAAAG